MSSVSEFRHSIRFDPNLCSGCMDCLRICPTEAIRVRNGSACMLKDHCIDCGECLKICPRRAIIPLTNSFVDFSRFRHNIAIPSPVFYTQFGKNISPITILDALLEVGFDSYYDLSRTCEAAGVAIEAFLDQYKGPYPLITPFCPAIVRMLQVKFSDLAELLLPIESPMEIAAREAKEKVAQETGFALEEIGAIYLTPCPVKMISIQHHPRKPFSNLDGAIAISDIYNPIRSVLMKTSGENDKPSTGIISGVGAGWSRLDGLSRSLTKETLVVSGLDYVTHIFEEIDRGQLRDIELVECHTCRVGCVGGSLNVENPYVARHNLRELQGILGREPILNPKEIIKQFKDGIFSVDKALPVQPIKPLDDDLKKAIERMKQREKLVESLPGINCGVCGAPSCKAFAEDVVLGRDKETSCFFIQRQELERLLRRSLDYLERTAPDERSDR